MVSAAMQSSLAPPNLNLGSNLLSVAPQTMQGGASPRSFRNVAKDKSMGGRRNSRATNDNTRTRDFN